VAHLEDSFGRRFSYLRLSITDACNFSCSYCLPSGYPKSALRTEPLTLDEVRRLVRAFVALGTRKVRLTGGEPTLRRDLLALCQAVRSNPGVERLALSTNGYRLKDLAGDLRLVGVDAINVSIDSLDPARFEGITGGWKLAPILEGIERALVLQFSSVKINAVLLKEHAAEELERFLGYLRHTPVSLRLIELMPTAQNRGTFEQSHVKSDFLAQRILAEGWRQIPRGPTDGPAIEFRHPGYAGRIGIIAPYSDHFCESCNRLRVTSQGDLRLCLFAEGNAPLRDLLQRDAQQQELQERLLRLVGKKEISHFLSENRTGDNRSFSVMGG
jgi:GTP 3',8-cyclase